MNIIRDITRVNRTVLSGKKNKYIVIHYTGNQTDTAKGNANYFRSANRGASAQYFVDKTTIYQVVEDKDAAWAVGRNYGSGNLFNIVTNNNSINIEMCSDNGAIAEATFNNTVELTKQLMAKYGITAGNVYRHYDVCSKRCPGWTGWLPGNESLWIKFKNAITGKVEVKTPTPTTAPVSSSTEQYTVKILCDASDPLAVREGPGTNYKKVTTVRAPYKYTIVETKNGWGRLKSGKGWINVNPKYVQRV